MITTRVLLVALVASFLLLPSCKKEEDKASAQTLGTEMDKAVGEIREFSAEKAAEMTKAFDKKMLTLGEKIDSLKKDVATKGDEAKMAMDATLMELDKKRKELTTRLAQLPTKTGEAWIELEKEISDAYAELEKMVDKAKKDLM